jgi:hypothetical protein
MQFIESIILLSLAASVIGFTILAVWPPFQNAKTEQAEPAGTTIPASEPTHWKQAA